MPKQQNSPDSGKGRWVDLTVGMLNGAVGDYLRDQQNGLAIDMAFYVNNRPLVLTRENILRHHPQPSAKLCILVHGLSCTESIWDFRHPLQPDQHTSYGALLQIDHGYTPFYVRYNTGLAVAENGKRLATLLDELALSYPTPIKEITLIGHSMGGLVLRSACHYADQHHESWVRKVKRIFYLSTPHDGAELEQLAHATEMALSTVPNSVTRLVGKVFKLRSQGIKDLRFGTLLEPDVMDDGWDDRIHHHRRAVPWLPHAQHYLIGGTLKDDPQHAVSLIFGDGLVAPPRTSGSPPGGSDRPIPAENVRVFAGLHHLRLAHDGAVYQQIKAWCEST